MRGQLTRPLVSRIRHHRRQERHTMRLARIVALGVAVAFGLSLVEAAEDEKDGKAAVLKLADAVAKNDDATVKKLVDELKKQDLEEIMYTMKPPMKKGLDVGVKEGIETKIIALSKKATDVPKNADTYE